MCLPGQYKDRMNKPLLTLVLDGYLRVCLFLARMVSSFSQFVLG